MEAQELMTPPSSRFSESHRSKKPTGPKLRDSCGPCASSKVKCYREKPTCSRCAKRGLECVYSATKRIGRRRNVDKISTNVIETKAEPQEPLPNKITYTSPISKISDSASLGITSPSPQPTESASPFDPYSELSYINQCPSTPMTDTSASLDEIPISPLPCALPGIFVPEHPDSGYFFSTDGDNGGADSLYFLDRFSKLEDTVSSVTTPYSSTFEDTQSSTDFNTTINPSCSCPVQALGLMVQLLPSPATQYGVPPTQQLQSPLTLSTTEAVMINKATMEAVSTMLRCPCSKDGYLLTIMSLVVLKTIDRYTGIARKSLQLVLNELNFTRRLVNHLSLELKPLSSKSSGIQNTLHFSENDSTNGGTPSPLSEATLDHLNIDLHKRLNILSSEIIEALRVECKPVEEDIPGEH
ncbi:aflatoxin regulatory protein-domain-containing protein [Xylogone sp. PMI_703]|nr:aflatoxin regulatory protein-domain-containing protein [Xylogone sp. PMI_703]